MKRAILWVSNNILFLSTLFLLMFIPLYPKLPLLDVRNTWVYVRVEDFVVLLVLLFWAILLARRKVTLKTPLTLPILAFWIIGALSTIHGVILLFPKTANIFPNVAFLNFLRHVEYMSLFFVAYAGMRDKRFLKIVIIVLIITLLVVVGYGIGQKYLEFPAYLTMNEEFAKGIPIKLSPLSRVPSTFAGHYDLAAYLVLVIPILASLVFGFRNWFIKTALVITVILGFGLLFMTVSRVSFFVLLIVLFVVLFFQNKKLVIVSLPVLALFGFAFLSFQPSLLSRFGNTIREVNVLVDAATGEAIGHINYVPSSYLEDKIIKQKYVGDREALDEALTKKLAEVEASPSAPLVFGRLPPEIPLVVATNVSTGENLPQGTGYINLSLSPVTKRLGSFYYEVAPNLSTTSSAEVLILHGDFLAKRAAAYDLSFTTRFQGEWPRALSAFERNILLGSGYGSVSLAVDNNYFRMLGEIGLLGIASFLAIFLSLAIYIKRVLPNIESRIVRSFVLGFAAGVIGLFLNATLIDVFEASKVAFLLWILTGVVLGVLSLYQAKNIDLYKELKKVATSTHAIIVYLLIGTIFIFSPIINNFFVGDDFTWFRWAQDCQQCIFNYFTDAQGFFYRPGTKVYFFLMYQVFWLNQVAYHAVSILLHSTVLVLFFFLARKILRNTLLASLAAFLLLIMSGYSEDVFWISSIGYLFNAVFVLSSILMFILWEEKKKVTYYTASIIFISLGFLFHEVGVITPLLIIAYKIAQEGFGEIGKIIKKTQHLFLFAPVMVYLLVRWASGSHWFSGDYSYSLIKLPFNVVGNLIGYLLLTILGPSSFPAYSALRINFRENLALAIILIPMMLLLAFVGYRIIPKYLSKDEKKVTIFSLLFFIIVLLPFLGLGNIASRYSYLASLGLILVFVLFIKKLYTYLKTFGRDIATGSIVTIIATFALFHIIQVQQLHGDWNGAGKMSKNFFIAIDSLYSDYWSREPVELHFVNVPIRNGQAWVFPVGLDDAIFFAFENRDLKVYIHQALQEALALAGDSPARRVFVFQADGSLKEISRPKSVVPKPPRVN